MSEKDISANFQSGSRKKGKNDKKKRQASSPLNDYYYIVLDLNGKECVNTGERKKNN